MKAFAVDQEKSTLKDPCFCELDLDMPQLGPRDLLVHLKAIAVNPLDIKQRILPFDSSRKTEHRILGWDGSGVVEKVGAEVSLFKPGDEVYYAGEITRQGSYAQYQVVDERIVGHKPRSLTFERSAGLALTSITAWEGLFDRLRIESLFPLKRGPSDEPPHARKCILIIGGAGGVGSMAIQLAKKIAGLEVIASASRPNSVAWCKSMGADHVVDHTKDLVEEFRALGKRYADWVFILNDTDTHFNAACELLIPQGLICSIVPNLEPLNLDALRSKSGGLVWEAMFVRSKARTVDMIEQHRLLNQVAHWVDQGVLRDTVNQTYSPINTTHLRQAHLDLQSQRTLGKIVLSGFE